jgi:O-antigen/teichoic acid export membrane protein
VQWGVVDQAVSSLTNFGIALAVARQASPREFGTFSLALTLYVTLLWASRSVTTEPFVVRFTAEPPDAQRAAARPAVGAALTAGLLAAGVLVAVGAAGDSLALRVLGAMACGMPGLLAQDAFRYVLFAAGRARSAVVNDVVWLASQMVMVVVLLATDRASAATLSLAFGAGATLAAVLGAVQTGVVPAPARSLEWVRRHRDLGGPFFLELVAVTGMMQVALLGVAATAGAAAIGGLRAAMLLLGPLTVLFVGMFVISVPEAIRARERGTPALLRMVRALGVGLPAITGLWAGAVLLLPDGLGVDLLGANWAPGRHLVPPVAVLIAGHGCALAAVVGLRALGAARQSLGARLWGAPVFLAGGIGGSLIEGAYGAGVGLAVAAWVDAGLAWWALKRVLVRGAAAEPLVPPESAPAPAL